jgi:organic radical activating enzyme
MFGENPLLKPEYGSGRSLRVVKGSPFLTIQGEGPHAGRGAIFIRLHGCNLACTFCDTNFSDPDDPTVKIEDLVKAVEQYGPPTKLVVLTGGEPLRQPIIPLCHQLAARGYEIQIETAGVLWQPSIHSYTELVVSPKTPVIHDQIYRTAAAFKYVIDVEQAFGDDSFLPTTATQARARKRRLAAPRPGAPVYLSPMDTGDPERNARNHELVAHLAIKHGVIAGVQLHKILDMKEPR